MNVRKHDCFQYGAVPTALDPRYEKCAMVGCPTIRLKKGAARVGRTRKSTRPTQAHRVLAILSDGAWHCGVEFVTLHPPILRYSARVSDLQEPGRGHRIESRPCRQHDHPVYEFRLLKEVQNASEAPRQEDAP